ncbi:Tetratricopeptide repeat (TPR)-like superfamily protein [Hibiscus syriacus]|uniref:Tetratricopeptide repeat (TPR)-like superfamily protein n=1 Tax=Hibiscus syriacus TaxID=106335 RepID=A0A6A2ZGB6_HIBSY|nr:Tetratricopeptide repeat (TPR)-like superfamily protein [Hibiscus syriacus]
MTRRYVPSLPAPSLQRSVLHKQRSWCPDAEREEAWLKRKELYGRGIRRTQSFTDHDIEDLKGCIDLGDDPEMVKTRLRQWAQVVACSVRQISGEPK